MVKKTNSKSTWTWVILSFWVVAIGIGAALLLGLYLQQKNAQSAEAAQISQNVILTDAPIPSLTATPEPPTDTPMPPTQTPTLTATLTSTVTSTATEIPFQEGPIKIGVSVLGNPLEVWRFGTGRFAYMVAAGVHGGYEVNTVRLADELITYFSGHPELIPPDTTLYILRAINVDGLNLPNQPEGRMNVNGVDLNRNYPIEWQAEWRKTGCWDFRPIHGGAYPASEPETVALMAFVIEHPLIAFISYHSAAPGFYPSGDPPHADSVALAQYLSAASGYPYPAVNMGCQMTGTMVDWVHSMGTAALDVELSNHWSTEFDTNLRLVRALMDWRP